MMGKACVLILTMLWFSVLPFVTAAQDIVRYMMSTQYPEPKLDYFVALLTLALEQSSGQYGSYVGL